MGKPGNARRGPSAMDTLAFTCRLVWTLTQIAGVALTAPISVPLLFLWMDRQNRRLESWITSQACPVCGRKLMGTDIRLARQTVFRRFGELKRRHPGSKVDVWPASVKCSGCQKSWRAHRSRSGFHLDPFGA
jgi:hypothetical protein